MGRRRVSNLAQQVVAFDQAAKRGVFPVQKWRVIEAKEKLAPSGVGVVRAGHRKDAARMRTVVKFGFAVIAGTASPPTSFRGRILSERIAALDHEALDDAVKSSAIVKALPGKL